MRGVVQDYLSSPTCTLPCFTCGFGWEAGWYGTYTTSKDILCSLKVHLCFSTYLRQHEVLSAIQMAWWREGDKMLLALSIERQNCLFLYSAASLPELLFFHTLTDWLLLTVQQGWHQASVTLFLSCHVEFKHPSYQILWQRGQCYAWRNLFTVQLKKAQDVLKCESSWSSWTSLNSKGNSSVACLLALQST